MCYIYVENIYYLGMYLCELIELKEIINKPNVILINLIIN